MADKVYENITVGASVVNFGESDTNQQFTWQAPEANTGVITIVPNTGVITADPVAGAGFIIEGGNTYFSHNLPPFMRNGPWKAIASAADQSLVVCYSKARTPSS
jgi:hypothetical protein